jgi:ribosome biogenesis GTPase / thiamine phosphate phosphatase
VYRVVLDDGRSVAASLRGRLKQQQRTGMMVVIGDEVTVEQTGDVWAIEEVRERRAELVRRGRGGRAAKLLAANLDTVLAVVSAKDPDVSVGLVDRLLVVAEASGMHPVLIINKVDLPGASEASEPLRTLYEDVGYRVVLVSAESKQGLAELHELLCAGTSTLMGPSGVGKSSLLNAVDPELDLKTGLLSRKTGTGRHTTVGSRLIPLACGGLVADTPGFGDVGLWGVVPEEVESCFPEFAEHVEQCRFRRCAHIHEPDCGVREAVQAGVIAESRYASYLTARSEAGDAVG